MNWKRIVILLSLAGCFLFLSLITIAESSIVTVGPDIRGVVLSPYEPAGYRSELLMPGRYWLRPGEHVRLYSISHQTYTTLVDAPGSDSIRVRSSTGEELLVDVSAMYAINAERLLELHISWQGRHEDGLVRPLIRGTTRNILSESTTNEIKVSRSRIEQVIFEALEQEFAENYLILLDFKIINIQ